jgi:hypothetical protein
MLTLVGMCWDLPAVAREAPAKRESIGLSFSFEVASAYVFRGYNLFRETTQNDQNALFAPSVTYTLGETGLSLTYWGGYQWTGSNQADLVAAGPGHEQDLILTYAHTMLSDTLTLSGSLTYYFFPFASKEDAGTRVTSYLEPAVSASFATLLDLGLKVAYFAGLQEAVKDLRYLYLSPSVGKTLELHPRVALALGLGAGFKIYNDRDRMKDNVYDISFNFEFPVRLSASLAITPAMHMAWSNFEALRLGEEYVIWGGITFGADL